MNIWPIVHVRTVIPTTAASIRPDRLSRAIAAENRRTWPGTSKSCPSARPGPCMTTTTIKSAASPSAIAQSQSSPGALTGGERVSPAYHRRNGRIVVAGLPLVGALAAPGGDIWAHNADAAIQASNVAPPRHPFASAPSPIVRPESLRSQTRPTTIVE